VVAASQEDANAFASAAEIERAGTTLDSVLSDDIGAVIITEPFAAEAALRALAAGKPVLAAAPFARSAEEAERLFAAAREARVPIIEALWSPYLPAHRRAADLARGGTLGAPLHLALDLGTPVARDGNPALVEAGVLRILMPHALALAFELFGPVEDVDAAVTEEGGADVHASLLLRHAGGGISQLAASFTTLMSNSARIALTEGSIRIDDPVLAAEALAVKRVTTAATPSQRGAAAPTLVGGARSEITQRLRRSGVMRRVNRAVSLPRMETAGYGAHQLSPLLTHFANLAAERTVESDILPTTRTVEILRLLDAVRPATVPSAPTIGLAAETPAAAPPPAPEAAVPADESQSPVPPESGAERPNEDGDRREDG
jgi:predicted dehydrogenase